MQLCMMPFLSQRNHFMEPRTVFSAYDSRKHFAFFPCICGCYTFTLAAPGLHPTLLFHRAISSSLQILFPFVCQIFIKHSGLLFPPSKRLTFISKFLTPSASLRFTRKLFCMLVFLCQCSPVSFGLLMRFYF